MTSCFGGILLPVLAVFYFRLWRLFGLLMGWLVVGWWLVVGGSSAAVGMTGGLVYKWISL
jgi:hypothetical protein